MEYFPRQDLVVLLLMGIDKEGPVQSSGSYNNDGEADVVSLLIFDKKDKVMRVLSLNRDTMTDVPVLGIGGRPAGSVYGQLALAHTFGTGLEDSCDNTVKAVSDLLLGAPIDHYMALNMDAIPIANDAVGGVTVKVTDDFSAIDPSLPMGEVTLRGEQATTFIRTRKGLGDQLNLSRMQRQKVYMEGFLEALRAKRAGSDSFLLKMYEDMADYAVTDCSFTTLNSILGRYAQYPLAEIVVPEGQNVEGEEFMEFHLNEESFEDLVLRLFFAEKK
ncbi:MAG: LCP family protein [Clostridia bacterium]|nr:LCP family protein [Clostridia bacterium]